MKSPFPRLAAVVFVALAFTLRAPAAELPSVLLQKGIFAEETEGNVDAAIKIYEQITTEAATNRAVVAQAQYRLAVCYQKKGNKEQAIKQLNELVQQSPANTAVNKQARDALVALGETPATGLSIRRVLQQFSVGWVWNFSVDGRYVTYESRLPEEDIFVGELATGKSWMVFHGEKDKETPWTNALISPDNSHIAFDVSNRNGGTGIYVANLDGSERRRLYSCDPSAEEIYVLAWSPDGSRVLATNWIKAGTEENNSLVAFDVKTGAKSEIARPANSPHWDVWLLSPDSRLLARRKGDYPRRITVLNLASGREEVVIDRDATWVVGWLPDSKRLVFSKISTYPDGEDLWAVNLENGMPVAPPEKIWSNLGAGRRPFVGRDGNLYYSTRQKNKPDSYELWIMEGFLPTKLAAAQTESWRIQTDIPPAEMILGADNSIVDQKFGFGAALPSGWTVSRASRRGDGGTIIQFTSSEIRDANAQPARIIYFPTTPWANPEHRPANDFAASGAKPTTAQEIDAWLRKHVSHDIEGHATTNGDWMTKIDGSVSKVINAHHAITVTGSYTRNGKLWNQIIALYYSENLIVSCQLRVPAENLDAIRPSFERLAESIRLP